MDEWINLVNGWIVEWMNGSMNGWMVHLMNKWISEWMVAHAMD